MDEVYEVNGWTGLGDEGWVVSSLRSFEACPGWRLLAVGPGEGGVSGWWLVSCSGT